MSSRAPQLDNPLFAEVLINRLCNKLNITEKYLATLLNVSDRMLRNWKPELVKELHLKAIRLRRLGEVVEYIESKRPKWIGEQILGVLHDGYIQIRNDEFAEQSLLENILLNPASSDWPTIVNVAIEDFEEFQTSENAKGK